MKKFLILILLTCFLSHDILFASQIKGRIEQNDNKNPIEQKDIYTGEKEILKENKTVKMTVSQVLSSGLTQVGDEFFAEIASDVVGEKGVIIPIGSIAHGKVNTIAEPKNMGRDGFIILDFDYVITPDGSEIPISGGISTKDNIVKGTAKNVAESAGYTLGGGVLGGLTALNLLGLEAAIASHGYTIAGGAAIGGVIGLIGAIRRKGDRVFIKPGDELKIKILSDIELPVFSDDAFKKEELVYDGLSVQINQISFDKDPFGVDNVIKLNLNINNRSKKTFSTFDMALVSDTNMTFYPSPFSDNSLWMKKIKPGDNVIGTVSFSVFDRKHAHWLVFYDKINKKPLAMISIDNACTELGCRTNKKKKFFR